MWESPWKYVWVCVSVHSPKASGVFPPCVCPSSSAVRVGWVASPCWEVEEAVAHETVGRGTKANNGSHWCGSQEKVRGQLKRSGRGAKTTVWGGNPAPARSTTCRSRLWVFLSLWLMICIGSRTQTHTHTHKKRLYWSNEDKG